MNNLKTKALILNFVCFAVLFIVFRFLLVVLFHPSELILAISAAIIATIVSPKFGVAHTEKGDCVMMKWIFIKGFKKI
ncbi:hypothetical protein ACG2LH_14530 [Zhouia sp. PK063]|uniref:hypothetical protein n=1 Tax=Zhouia sp. PK063 TaxID=3373602 RepID=UPI0037B54DE9